MATKIIAYIRPKDKLALVEQLRLVGNYLGNLKHQTVPSLLYPNSKASIPINIYKIIKKRY